MTAVVLAACLLAAPHGVCVAEGEAVTSPPPLELPVWATAAWRNYAASIIAGETVPGCERCHLWIACTIVRDIARGYNPWGLYPGRWHGWNAPHIEHYRAVWTSLRADGCGPVPNCRFLGNWRDYETCWAGLGPAELARNRNPTVVCVLW